MSTTLFHSVDFPRLAHMSFTNEEILLKVYVLLLELKEATYEVILSGRFLFSKNVNILSRGTISRYLGVEYSLFWSLL